MCSNALVWGMSYEQFWQCKWSEFFAYMRKYQIEQETQAELIDTQAWQQAVYIKAVLQDVYPLYNAFIDHKKNRKQYFPKKPFVVKAKKAKKQDSQEPVESLAERIKRHNLEIAMLGK